MKNIKSTIFIIILCFSTASAFAKNNAQTERLNSACLSAFANMKAKKINFCKCYTYNMPKLISLSQFQPLLKWLGNKMSDQQQNANEALIDLDYEVSAECVKDSSWIAPKILESSNK